MISFLDNFLLVQGVKIQADSRDPNKSKIIVINIDPKIDRLSDNSRFLLNLCFIKFANSYHCWQMKIFVYFEF